MEDPLNPYVSSIVQYYSRRVGRRGPYGVANALQKAQSADANSLDQIFLNGGDLAWRAYFVVNKDAGSEHGYEGLGELTRFLDELGTQPVGHQLAFAKRLDAAMQSAQQQEAENDEGNIVRKSTKRRRTAIENGTLPLPTPNTTPDDASTDYTDLEPSSQHGSAIRQDGVHVDASLQAVKPLLPVDFFHAIQRVPHSQKPGTLVADITLFVQKGQTRDNFGCQMEIGIVKEKIAYYARKLCGVEVEVKDGVRYIRYPSGSKIEPDPSLKLRACQRDMIPVLLGHEINAGFSASPIYKREAEEVRDDTDGVSITIPSQEKEGVYRLSSPPERGAYRGIGKEVVIFGKNRRFK
ncbi:unnamed protein product [Clonostachys solani]|uniref:Uncharacterized protein n=1 Tax=Clonostachys solani TaxID=160281 RepID=A0A9P0EE09_9HYPO|nr:unnamed protein product [Clonostachys solani]